MSNIATSTIGKTIRSFPDLIFSTALPKDDAVTSDVVFLGKTQNALEIVVEVDTTVDKLAATKVLTIEYLYGADFDQSVTIFTATGAATTGTVFPLGELARFVPPSGTLPVEAKIKVTTDDDAIVGAISVFASLISR